MRLSTVACALAMGATTLANRDSVTEKSSQVCSGMYDKDSFGGPINPFISTNLHKFGNDEDINLAVVIFEYQDIELLGAVDSNGGHRKYVCDSSAVDEGLCDESHLGQFIVSDDLTGNKSQILTYTLNKTGAIDMTYLVKSTGYYCVATYTTDRSTKYDLAVNFRNSFGQLAASEYPKLPLYAILAIAYAVCFAYYSFNFWKHKHEVLPLQKYFLAFYLFLTLECVTIWGLYDLTNRKSSTDAGVKVYTVFVSILNGIKFTFSFFLLLVISLGYGIVVPKLERKLMLKCRIFAGIHLACAVMYILTNYLAKPGVEDSSFWALFAFPVIITTAIFYAVTLKSLSTTTALLQTQKQNVKLHMYQKLFRIIFLSMLVLMFGVIVSSFIFIGMSTTELVEQHWKTRFFFLDFWPTLVYFFIFNLIAFIWRPTDTSYMLAASSQLPTDPENAADFELDDLQSLQEDGGAYQTVGGDNDSLNLGSDNEDEGSSDPFRDPEPVDPFRDPKKD